MRDVPGAATHWTSDDDPRITRVGRVLRSTHLDELPQLINVLKGDLSIVGPRPEQPAYVSELDREAPVLRPATPRAAGHDRVAPGEVRLRGQRGRRLGEAAVRLLLPASPEPGDRPPHHRPHAPQRRRRGKGGDRRPPRLDRHPRPERGSGHRGVHRHVGRAGLPAVGARGDRGRRTERRLDPRRGCLGGSRCRLRVVSSLGEPGARPVGGSQRRSSCSDGLVLRPRRRPKPSRTALCADVCRSAPRASRSRGSRWGAARPSSFAATSGGRPGASTAQPVDLGIQPVSPIDGVGAGRARVDGRVPH